MKILVVEDEPTVAQTLQILFSSYNYAVDIAADGRAGLELAEAFEYDLILLDILLPKLDGISLCQRLRATGFQSPILLLTGQGGSQQKAIALNAGADDYVVKPFDTEELVARVQALLRRGKATSQPILVWGNLSLDPNSRKVTYGTHLLALTPKEYAILELFLRNSQTVFSARAILDHAWTATESPGEEAVRVHIKELRQKFKEIGAPKDLITTVHRVGYRLNSIYSSLTSQREPQLTEPQIAELKSVNEELRVALEQLRTTQAELQQKNQKLEIAYQTMEQERQQLQIARDEMEVALKQSEEKFRHFAETTNAVIWIAEPDSLNNLYVSPAYEAIWGRSRQSLIEHPDSWLEAIHPSDRDHVKAKLEEQRQGETSYVEYRIMQPDGSIRWIWDWGFAIRNDAGQVYLYGGVAEDITARKQTEITLMAREAQLQRLTSNVAGMLYQYILHTDGSESFAYISPRCRDIYELGPEELQQDFGRVWAMIHPEDVERVRQANFQSAQQLECFDVEFRLLPPSGCLRWVRAVSQPERQPNGDVIWDGLVLDITAQKTTAVALRESEQKYHQILDSIADMVFVKQPDSRLVWANKAFRTYYGMTLEELQGIVDAPFNEPDYTLNYIQDDAMVLTTGQTVEIPEEPVTRHDGVVRLFSTSKAPIYDENGQITMLVGVCRDITEQKQVEVKLRQRKEFLKSIYEGADQAIFVIDVDDANNFHYASFNRIAEQFAGNSTEELQGKTPEEAFGPAIGAGFRQNYHRCLQAGTSISYEEQVVFENHTLWTLTTLSPLRNEQGDIYRIVGNAIDITDRKQAELALQQQILREQLVAEISQDIRQSLNLHEVLSRTVERVRELLNTDRVLIFRFRSDWQGDIMMESVGADWISLLSTTIADPCFRDRYIESYRLGRIGILHDIDEENLDPCYVELLKQFQVKANLVVPILQGENLWGLLTVHHCSAPRDWQPSEIDLLRQLATQVGIAIQQSELYQQMRLDLLERERMQVVLEESEERFRTLSSAAPIGICQTNADGICIYTNAHWQEMSGLSFIDCLGDGWLQAVHPDDRPMIFQAWDAFIQGGSENLPEFRLLTPQGEVRWISAKVATMQSATSEVIGYVGICEDITDRKQAEQKIREQAALLDIASDAIFVRDLDHQILYWNQGSERLYGWSATEAIGQNAMDLLREPVTQITQILEILLDRGEWRGEIYKTTKAGKGAIVEAHWTLVRDESGQPSSILSVSTDITEKKQLEAQFYQAQRLESLGTLASGIAHDLNNVLTPILAITQLLRLKLLNLDERSQEMLRVLEDSAKRGANMIKQILTFTRGTGEKQIPLRVAPLLLEVAQVAQQTFPKSIAIRENISDQPYGLVSADPTHLHQVFMNLCVNARDAMPEGGTLTLSLENYFVDAIFAHTVLNARVGNYLLITIADTGTGISPELRDRIFEPFFTTKEPGKGTGLGLSTVLGIVKDYGGFVQVSSEVGQGSQFKIYLPTIEGTAEEVAQTEELLDGNGELVLIVDDDIAVQRASQSLLEHHHYKTLVANDGIEATALYAKHQDEIKVVLIDAMMPNMDGVTAIRVLQRINPQVKIIAISGLSANRESVLAAGANAFLLKPYSLEDLLQNLHDLLK